MRTITSTRFILMVATGLMLPVFAVEALADNCRNVSFRVTNRTGRAIDIKKVKYFNAANSKWKTENVGNGSERCNAGKICDIDREDLGGTDGDRITKIKFIYKEVNSNIERESNQFEPTDPVCRNEKIYGLGQGWELTTAASSITSGNGQCKDVQFKYRNNTNDTLQINAVNYFWGGRWRRELIAGGFWGYDRALCGAGETCLTLDVQSELDDPDHPGPDGNFDIVGMIAATRVANPNYGSNLGDADGADITQIKFEYTRRITTRYQDGSSSFSTVDGTSQIFRPTNPRCSDGRVYGEGQAWTIGNRSKTPTLIMSPNPTIPSGAVPGNNNPKKNGGKGKNKGKNKTRDGN